MSEPLTDGTHAEKIGDAKAAALPSPITTTKGDTSYVLLSRVDISADHWKPVATIQARDGEAAIKAHLEAMEDPRGTFVAIASKFWRPVTPDVKVETTTTITLNSAS